MTKAKKNKPPFPVQSGMGEHGLAYCLIKNQEARTPWDGDDDTLGIVRLQTVDCIIDLRAHGLHERDVIANARRFVAEWFENGSAPKPFGNPAVTVLAHVDGEYPLTGKARFVSILIGRGCSKSDAARMIGDAVRDGLIRERRNRVGISYALTHEPRTRAICDLVDRVTAMMPRHPFGVPFGLLRNAAVMIAGGGMFRGAVLIERALNAGVLHCAVRDGERFCFPNFKRKGR